MQASVIGRVTGTGQLTIRNGLEGETLANVRASTLHDDAPEYNRPLAPPPNLAERRSQDASQGPVDLQSDLIRLICDPSWVYSQYDHQLFLNTVVGPGADGTLLRLRDPKTGRETGRGIGLSTDGNHRWCHVDPRLGTTMVVAEAVMNIACVGATPLAVVNCLNFGNPEHSLKAFIKLKKPNFTFNLIKGGSTDNHCLYASHSVWESEQVFVDWKVFVAQDLSVGTQIFLDYILLSLMKKLYGERVLPPR